MVSLLRNSMDYLNAYYFLVWPKCMGIGIQIVDKTNETLSVMTVFRNTFRNGAMAYTCYKFMKVLFTELSWHVQF